MPSILQRHRTMDAIQEGNHDAAVKNIIKNKKNLTIPHILIYFDL
jgi:hypothetical protein